MLLQSIKLVNFRQFLNEEIAFASGKDGKNVTIILGENGTGKTTFAQAFFWCLYGETEFSDKMILNRLVANKLLSGQSAKVSVELVLQHGENTYTITREQTRMVLVTLRVQIRSLIFCAVIKPETRPPLSLPFGRQR